MKKDKHVKTYTKLQIGKLIDKLIKHADLDKFTREEIFIKFLKGEFKDTMLECELHGHYWLLGLDVSALKEVFKNE